MQTTKEFWNKEAPHWSNPINLFGPLTMPIFKQIWESLEPIEEELPKSATIINLGAGVNNKAYLPKTDNNNIVALDISQEMLKRNPASHKIITDLTEGIPLANQIGDLVVSFFLMRYLNIDAQLRLLIDIERVLRESGKVVIADLHRGAFSGQEKTNFVLADFLQLVPQAGFNILSSNSKSHKHTMRARHGYYTQSETIEANIGIAILGK